MTDEPIHWVSGDDPATTALIERFLTDEYPNTDRRSRALFNLVRALRDHAAFVFVDYEDESMADVALEQAKDLYQHHVGDLCALGVTLGEVVHALQKSLELDDLVESAKTPENPPVYGAPE